MNAPNSLVRLCMMSLVALAGAGFLVTGTPAQVEASAVHSCPNTGCMSPEICTFHSNKVCYLFQGPTQCFEYPCQID